MKYLLPLLLLLSSCDLLDPTEGVMLEDVIQLSAVETELLADGQDRTELIVTLGPEASPNQTVVLTTEQGRFAGALADEPQQLQLTIPGKEARVTLIADNRVGENVTVSAELSGFTAQQNLTFQRAFPDDMILSADVLSITADKVDFATLTVELFRSEGVPSDQAKVFFEWADNGTTATVQVPPFAFTAGAMATATIRSLNGQPGEITLTAKVDDGNGGFVERALLFTLN